VKLHGMPERIISDRDPRFTAHFWKAFWAGLGTTLSMSTAYHPQTDGQTENANRTLEIMLRSVINFEQDDWEDHLAAAELAVNNARNETTGLSPFYMFYGREARSAARHRSHAAHSGTLEPVSCRCTCEMESSARQSSGDHQGSTEASEEVR